MPLPVCVCVSRQKEDFDEGEKVLIEDGRVTFSPTHVSAFFFFFFFLLLLLLVTYVLDPSGREKRTRIFASKNGTREKFWEKAKPRC